MLRLILAIALFAATPPDIIRLKDGGFMRGTISELVPGDHVVIVLPNGESRTLTMDKVEYAGPDPGLEAAPGGPKKAPTVPGVKLHLTSPQKNARFYLPIGMRVGRVEGGAFEQSKVVHSEDYKELCRAPCDVTLQAGSYALALAIEGGDPVRSAALLDIDGPTSVEGVYTSYSVVRALGWVTSVVGGAVGVVLLIKPPGGETDLSAGRILPGALTIIGSGILGGILTRVEDDADIYVIE